MLCDLGLVIFLILVISFLFILVVSICFYFFSGSLGSFACFSGFVLLFPVLAPHL